MSKSVVRRKSAGIKKTLAAAVSEAREAKSMSQQAVGYLAGTGANTVSEIEQAKGNPRLDTIDRIAGVLGLQVVISSEAA